MVELPQPVAGRVAQVGLGDAGAETAATPPESRLRVTLSEDARGLLFVAEVFNGDNRQIAMLPWHLPSSSPVKPRVSITNKLLWTQAEPILDILLVDSASEMLVLSANKVVSYRLIGDKWTLICYSFTGAAPASASRSARAAGSHRWRI